MSTPLKQKTTSQPWKAKRDGMPVKPINRTLLIMARQTPKQRLQTEAAGMGLSTDGTTAELKRRINAGLEAAADTAEAIHGSQLELPIESESKPSIHPMNGVALGAAIGAAWHLLG